MFEEDFERCFICQAPSQGLYCSSECRQQDKGSNSPAVKATSTPPVRLTAQLPVSLSPMARPAHHLIAPSPLFVGRTRAGSSSSSSLSDSPIPSPRTNASAGDSPQKEAFNLPPPAYPTPTTSFGFIGSVPVKIPAALASRVPSSSTTNSGAATPGSHTTAASHFAGTSVDTLRFGRKPSVTNSVTSPLALAPRCGCGRALGHRARSRDRLAEEVSCLQLSDDGTTAAAAYPGAMRIVSESGFRTPRTPNQVYAALNEERSIATVLGSSLLSRSRSDPVPTSPRLQRNQQHAGIHPRPTHGTSGRNTPSIMHHAPLPAVAPGAGPTTASTLPARDGGDERRGRSRERLPPRMEMTPEQRNAKLVHHEEREVAPVRESRSRGRNSRDLSRERESGRLRSDSRGNDIGLALNLGDVRGRAPRVLA